MSKTNIHLYREANGDIPLLEWLIKIKVQNKKVFEKCIAGIKRLEKHGHQLRRPHADFLRDGIYELRMREQNIQCRILYFFEGKNCIILSHGLVKKDAVPSADIDRAIARKVKCEQFPEIHICSEGNISNG